MPAPRNPEVTMAYEYEAGWTTGLTNDEVADVRMQIQARIKAEYADLAFASDNREEPVDSYDLNVVLDDAATFVNEFIRSRRATTNLNVGVAGATKLCIYNVHTGEHSNSYTFALADNSGRHAPTVTTDTGKDVKVPMSVRFSSDCVFG